MTDWNDGYVSDIAYSGGVYREQMPSHLDAACLVTGYEPAVAPGAPFTYCELGCGLGDTALVVAAAYANACVWGYDFNPIHIAQARACAARAGLDNLVLAERSFEDLATAPHPEVPPLDYVTLHGVWTWISPANRAHIVTFLRRNLKPGGVFCVSYNAMPGWSGSIGLQRLFVEAARQAGGGSDRGIGGAIALARRISDAGGSALNAADVTRIEGLLTKGHVAYLSHEYLNDHWAPAFFADVAAALAPAKLSYIGSANMLENFPQLCLRPDQWALIDTLPAQMRQTVHDYFCPRTFRRDIYVRGPRPLSERRRQNLLAETRLALAVPFRFSTREIEIPLGKATLNEPFYGPALATLGRCDAAIGDLLAAAAPGTAPVAEEVLGMLVGGRAVLPISGDDGPAARARVRRFNRVRIEMCAEDAQTEAWLAGSAIGAAIRVGIVEMLVYEVLQAGEAQGTPDYAAVGVGVRALMAGRGMSVRTDVQDAVAGLDAEVAVIVAEIVPIWRRLGIL